MKKKHFLLVLVSCGIVVFFAACNRQQPQNLKKTSTTAGKVEDYLMHKRIA